MAVDRKIFTEDVDVGLKANKEFTKFYLNCKIDGKTKQKIFEPLADYKKQPVI